jgi:hypothetical protein
MHITPPRHPFDANDKEWQHYAFRLASELDLPLQNIAALCGINWTILKTSHKPLQSVIAAGRATFKARAMQELAYFLFSNPDLLDDAAERARVSAQKLDALKTWLKIEAKREEMEMLSADKDKDRDVLTKLSTEELRQKAKALLGDTK